MKPAPSCCAQSAHIAVHIHVFYPEIIPELRRCLDAIEEVAGPESVKSIVTFPDTKLELERAVAEGFPESEVLKTPNRGYDIGPFFEALRRFNLDETDFVVKLHSKRDISGIINFLPLRGSGWRRRLLAFCATPAAFRRSLAAFARDPSLGMIAHPRLIDPSGVGSGRHPERCEALLGRLGLEPHGRTIVYGTMFMVRARLMKPFLSLGIDDCDDPAAGNLHKITGVAHAAEGAFAMAVEAQGFRVASGMLPPCLSCIAPAALGGVYRTLRLLSEALRHPDPDG